MALKTTATIGSSIEVKEAYKRIDALRFDHPIRVYVALNTYESEEDAKKGGSPILPIENHEFTVDQFGGKDQVSISKAYELVKETEQNEDVEDAL